MVITLHNIVSRVRRRRTSPAGAADVCPLLDKPQAYLWLGARPLLLHPADGALRQSRRPHNVVLNPFRSPDMNQQHALNTAAQIVLLAAAGMFVMLRAGGGHATAGATMGDGLLNDAGRPAVACTAQAPAPAPVGYLQLLTRTLVASEALELPECER
jgi:hypothetical protein